MQKFSFKPAPGVCSRNIEFTLDDGRIFAVDFVGGCPGNLLGISKLVAGMEAEKVIGLLENIRCGSKVTSCPDQFARALKAAIGKK